ncbi:hypothetical protein HRU45_04080 [Candidatus Dependentiae bacterium]|nr:hypothetical protein [Candidatus Dependentiae bacterium]
MRHLFHLCPIVDWAQVTIIPFCTGLIDPGCTLDFDASVNPTGASDLT